MPEQLFDIRRLLTALHDAGVRFVVIGGVAANVHGSDRPTLDLDVVYAREPENLAAVIRAITPLKPQLRTREGAVPFIWDLQSLKSGFHFTLTTEAGDINLLGDAPGVGPFDRVWDEADEVDLFGMVIRVATVDDLIAMKRFVSRGKDNLHLLDLEAIRTLRQESTLDAGGEEGAPG